MIFRKYTLSIISIGLLAVLLTPVAAFAGADYGSPANAAFYSDGSGYCSGTLNGFLASQNSGNYLIVQEYAWATDMDVYVACEYNGKYKYAPINPGDTALINTVKQLVMLPREVNIYVHWNTSGNVDGIQIYNTSYYH